ncbi:hypothetical protein [Rubellimicrobium arenae]|uniref:hypothetical protein n=1 Tax=Rubellimicrobium arenae TaxID=2817372 RepID=UPI001B30CA4D|nr:hypothetical protein [Rubellimicrobium arenae]
MFTPWLADNLDHLSAAIGIPLEFTGREVPVEGFWADILARNPQDDSVVLIENQLEVTDHTHLGQIMTYLAGLKAQTVIWVAPQFREPHLSAIRWLNEHTAEDFSFFAVRLRVVRIGDSPFAPIFEVVEKPNGWERRVAAAQSQAKTTGDRTLGDQRVAYWTTYKARHPDTPDLVSRLSYFGTAPERMPEITVCTWIGQKDSGVFVRGRYGEDRKIALDFLSRHAAWLERRLGVTLGPKGQLERNQLGGLIDPSAWPSLIDWQEDERRRIVADLDDLATSSLAAWRTTARPHRGELLCPAELAQSPPRTPQSRPTEKLNPTSLNLVSTGRGKPSHISPPEAP